MVRKEIEVQAVSMVYLDLPDRRDQLAQLAAQDHWVILELEEFQVFKGTPVQLALRVKEDKLVHQVQLDWWAPLDLKETQVPSEHKDSLD